MNIAKSLFLKLTDGTGRVDRLYGPSHAKDRAAILSAIDDSKTIPASKATWGRFIMAIKTLYNVDGNCIAEREAKIAIAAKSHGITERLKIENPLLVNLRFGQSAWNPACTTCVIQGPATVEYRLHEDGGIDAVITEILKQ